MKKSKSDKLRIKSLEEKRLLEKITELELKELEIIKNKSENKEN